MNPVPGLNYRQNNRVISARLQIYASMLVPGEIVTNRRLADAVEISCKTVQRDLDHARLYLAWPLEALMGKGYRLTAKLTLCACCQRSSLKAR